MEGLRNFLISTDTYTISDIDMICDMISPYLKLTPQQKGIQYYNIPASFDIETSSFFRSPGKCDRENVEGEKVSIMYVWMFCIYGVVIIGRTWDEFMDLCRGLCKKLHLYLGKRLIVYIHNLAYEFAFMRKWFAWDKVFSLKPRTPVYAIADMGIEFRCSYILTGLNLENVGENLTSIKIGKKIGDLDYSLLRNSLTPLSDDEIGYCVNDVKIVVAHIGECIDEEGSISKIPLTKTGYVRRYCKNQCFYENGIPNKDSAKRMAYRRVISNMRLTAEEYHQMKRAFQGGFTHANPFCVGKILHNVTSFDFTSSYPAVMVAEKFPMGSGELVDVSNMPRSEIVNIMRNYCCIFELELFDVEPKIWYDNYLSLSRCRDVISCQSNNGRVVTAKHLITTITEIDYVIIRKFYTFSHSRISNLRRYHKAYLPTDFVKAILKLYGDKTTLKGVPGKEVDYNKAKTMLNACYGMTVTDIVRPEITYVDNEWEGEGSRKDEPPEYVNVEKMITKYNNNRGRFLFYAWGVYVTAYARRNLFLGICESGYDYVYSDTDSIKILNAEKHIKFIEDYNKQIQYKLIKACTYHKISPDTIAPKTVKGSIKPLGVWDFDGHYEDFKTLGAKRYIVKYSDDPRNKDRGKIQMTVAGLNKVTGLEYMEKQRGGAFEYFNNGMLIPAGYTGKLGHTYIDESRDGLMTDYLGNTAEYHEKSACHLFPSPYKMSLAKEFTDFLLQIQHD